MTALVIGTALALGATRLLSTMLFGLASTDPSTFGEVAGIVAAASVLACTVPAMRIAKMALRSLM